MADFILSAASEADFVSAAQQLGFVNNGVIVTSGPLPDGSGEYYLTDPQVLLVPTGKMITQGGSSVPEMVSDGNVYRGLRINGNNPFTSGLPIPSQLTVYPRVKYLTDGSVDLSYTPPAVGWIA